MNFNFNYQLRICKKVIDAFKLRCKKLQRNPADMMREIITAFNEGRLTIKPTEEQKEESIYK